jgi:DNA polymerase-3 subunit delta
LPVTSTWFRSAAVRAAWHAAFVVLPGSRDGAPPVTVVVGDDEFRTERAISAVVAAVRVSDAETEVKDLPAAAIEPGQFAELLSPSLFGEGRLIVIRDVEQLAKEIADELSGVLRDPGDGVHLVIAHRGGARGKAILDAATASGAHRVDSSKLTRPSDRVDFVRAEFRTGGHSIGEDAARALLDAVGTDLRDIAAACSQLGNDVAGSIDATVVATYYRGRAEATGFAVADRALEGRLAESLEQLRWALAVGTAPVLISSALAQGIRAVAKVAAAPRNLRGADLARELGMAPWKIDRVRGQVRGWTPDGIGRAVRAIADADAQIKGAGTDSGYALEKAVLAVVAARNAD